MSQNQPKFTSYSTQKIANRKSDSVLTVCQDNINKRIFIENINDSASKLLNITHEEAYGVELKSVFSQSIWEIIDEYLDYKSNSNDLLSVLSKVSNIAVVNKYNESVNVSLKIFYSIASFQNLPKFEILLRDISLVKEISQLKNDIINRYNSKDYIVDNTNMPNRKIIDACMALIYDFNSKHDFNATFATINLDIDIYSDIDLFKKIFTNIKKNLRDEDILGVVDSNKIGIILFDCSKQDSLKVFNRIVYIIRQEKNTKKISANIGFSKINLKNNSNDVISKCSQISSQAQESGKIYSFMFA